MKLGSVEETITVTGDTPIVDIQSAQRQRVIDQELLEAIPTGRTPQVAAFMIPGVNLSNVDVGGTNIINTTGGSLSIHGGRVDDTRLLIDGITIANTEGTGWSANVLPNMGSTQEVSVDYSSVTAESITGGLQINMIPKTGGNRIRARSSPPPSTPPSRASNTNDELRRPRPADAQHLKLQYDINPGLGGPIGPTSCGSTRRRGSRGRPTTSAGCSRTRTPTTSPSGPTSRTPSNRAFSNAAEQSINLRLTWQANADQQDQLLLRSALALPVPHDGGTWRRRPPTSSIPDQRPALRVVDGDADRTGCLSKRASARGARSMPTRRTIWRIRSDC